MSYSLQQAAVVTAGLSHTQRGQVVYRWRITGQRTMPAEFIGYVEAPDHATAIEEAIRLYRVSEPQKQRRIGATQVSYG